MSDAKPTVSIQLWRADAIVLLNWLMTVDFDRIPVQHFAEKQALLDLLSALEQQRELHPRTAQQIDAARNDVGSDTGW